MVSPKVQNRTPMNKYIIMVNLGRNQAVRSSREKTVPETKFCT